MSDRNRCDGSVSTYQHLLGYLYLRIETKEYDCSKCKNNEMPLVDLRRMDNNLITSVPSNCSSYISFYSASDPKGWPKYLISKPTSLLMAWTNILRRRQQYCARLMTHGIDGMLPAKYLFQQNQPLKSFIIRSWPMRHLIQMKKNANSGSSC